MFESPRKSINEGDALSKSQAELSETPPGSPVSTGNHGKKNKRTQQPKQPDKRSFSAAQLCAEESSEQEQEQPEKQYTDYDTDEPIVRGIFQIGKKSHDVLLSSTRVTWSLIQPETPTGERTEYVQLKDMFEVKVKRDATSQQTGGTLLGITLFQFKKNGPKLKDHAIHFNNMNEILSGFQNRPKSLKVFVNPTSHKKEAYQIYRDYVAPLFQLADIKADVTKKGHTLFILVVAFGGDGSVAEMAHGLLLQAQMESGRDTDSMFTPVQAPLPLGLIQAGSTDTVTCSVYGIWHLVTTAMHIIMGTFSCSPVDVCSFSSLGRLLHFGFYAMFGFGGRTLALAERHQWMPPGQKREFAVIKTLANLKPEDCELSYLPVKKVQTEMLDLQELWMTNQGLFFNVSIMAIPCLCSMAPRGLAPNTRLNNGSMALIAAGNTSRSEFIKHLKRYNSVNNQFSFSFVETHTVQAVRLRPCSQGSWSDDPWNVNGDLREVPSELLIRVHPQLLTLFGVDIEEAEEAHIKCSCI
uniref:DAGKc domain-containing protein n=1 Tax=Oncorhynchus tshawytscha TaxID=74940 RepID=A0AAZ3P0B4_ONCTS